jgi:hypothetical protein
MNKFDKFECLDCGGDGIVVGKNSNGDIHQWPCLECNNGRVDHKAHLVQEDAHREFRSVSNGKADPRGRIK